MLGVRGGGVRVLSGKLGVRRRLATNLRVMRLLWGRVARRGGCKGWCPAWLGEEEDEWSLYVRLYVICFYDATKTDESI